MADKKVGLTPVDSWTPSASAGGLTPVDDWASPSATVEPRSVWDTNPVLSGLESVGNYARGVAEAMVLDPLRQIYNTPEESRRVYREGVDPVVAQSMRNALPFPFGVLPEAVSKGAIATMLGSEKAGAKIQNENFPPEQLPATEREIWASRVGSLAGLHPALRGPWTKMAASYFGSRGATLATDRVNQEIGAKPEIPMADWLTELAIKEPFNALVSIPLAGGLTASAHRITGAVTDAGRRGKVVTGRIQNRDASLADALARGKEVMIRVGGGKKEFGSKNLPLSRALEKDLPELKEKLTSLGAAQKGKPQGEGSLFDDVDIAVDEIKQTAVRDLDSFYAKIPKDKGITYGQLLGALEDSTDGAIAATSKPRRSVHTQELLRIADKTLTDVITYRQEKRDLQGKIVYGTTPDGKRLPLTETITEPEGLAFKKAYRRILTDQSDEGSRYGGASNADRAFVAKLLNKIKQTQVPIQELRDYDTQFSSQAGYKDMATDADKAASAEAYEILADNARKLKYETMKKSLSKEEFEKFSKTNRKYAVALKVKELTQERINETSMRGRGVVTPPVVIRNSAEGQMPSRLPSPLPSKRILTDPESMTRLAAPRNTPLSIDPIALPVRNMMYQGMEMAGEAVGPAARFVNDPVIAGAIAANRTEASEAPHPVRQLMQWMGDKAGAGVENIKRGVGAMGDFLVSDAEAVDPSMVNAPMAPLTPQVTPDQPMPRDVSVLIQNKEAFLQRAQSMIGNNPEVMMMLEKTLSTPNKEHQALALAELSKQLPDLFEQSEYPSEINGKLYDPMDKDDYERGLERQLKNKEIDTITYGKRMKAVATDGTILRDAPQRPAGASGVGAGGTIQTTQGARRGYDY